MPSSNLPLAARSRTWDGPAARRRMLDLARNDEGEINQRLAMRGFMFRIGDPQVQSSYKMPFADVIGGELQAVFRGITAAIGRLRQGFPDGTNQQQRNQAIAFLERQRDRFDEDEASMDDMVFSTPHVGKLTNLKVNKQAVKSFDIPVLKTMLASQPVSTIDFDAVVFIQGPNENNFEFRDEDLNSFGKSFAGNPFLRNHGQGDIGSRDGTILSSVNVGGEFRQHIELTTEEGIRDFAQGRIDRFSIGWTFDRALCSICELDYVSGCPHVRGRRYIGSDDNEQVCNIIFTKPQGVETSAVNVPAVKGTRILQLCRRKEKSLKLEAKMEDEVLEKDELEEELSDTGAEETAAITSISSVAATLLADESFLEQMAHVLHVADIDERLATLEGIVKEFSDTLTAVLQNQQQIGLEIDQLNGSVGKVEYEVDSEQKSFLPWGGYRGSVLGNLDKVEEPKIEKPSPRLRRPVETKSPSRRETETSLGKRELRGADALNLWNSGGER